MGVQSADEDLLGDTLAKDHFHLIGVQSGPVNYRRRVGLTKSDECEVSESVRRSLADPTWLPSSVVRVGVGRVQST